MFRSNGGFEKVISHLACKKHWRQIREHLWINRVWDEAHFDNEVVPICNANWAAGQRTLELDRKWRESITKIGLDAFTEKTNEVQKVRSS